MDLLSKSAGAAFKPADEYIKQLRNAAGMEQTRRFAEARQLYLAAAKAKPGDAAALDGAARMAAVAGDHRAGVEYLRAAIAANPERETLHDRLAGALLNAGDFAEAEEQTQAVL